MTAFYIVFRQVSVIGGAFLFQDADRVGLLQKRVADVFLVGKDVKIDFDI